MYDEIVSRVEELGPWHYCHELPFGIMTGTCREEVVSPKLVRLLAAGAFSKPVYPKVLDLGANSGLISMWFCDNRKSHVVAIEGGERYYPQLEFAVEVKGYSSWIESVFADVCKHDLGEECFDLVLCLGLLHHVGTRKHLALLRACRRALVSGGEIVVQTKTERPVLRQLRAVGFEDVRELYTYRGKTAWIATR